MLKKLLVVAMLATMAVTSFGCGRNDQFGTVDMKKIESESTVYKAIKEDMTAKAKTLQEEMMKETEGKSQEEAQKVVQDKSAKMQVIQTEAQNKLKTSFETAAGEVAKEKKLGAILVKEAVPQGGVDVTDDILKKMK
ncbi:MAG: OmpH family outer membrane protein [Acidaminococcaceae bacterium]|nr:OmpH family outer membrane protein [Acidaminococcaceae bacterium]